MPTLLSFRPPTYDIATAYPKVRRTVAAAQRRDAQALMAAYQAIDGWAGRYLATKALARDDAGDHRARPSVGGGRGTSPPALMFSAARFRTMVFG